MTVRRCHLCEENPLEARRYGGEALAEGAICPLCYQPTCRFHLTMVRWRWRDGGRVDSTLVCKECRRTYAHRDWDAANRDWIT
jgi:uncharacterized protein YbaR (Trm112 family)